MNLLRSSLTLSIHILGIVIFLSVSGFARAQEKQNLFFVPEEVTITLRDGSFELRYDSQVVNYVMGLGWLAEGIKSQPVVDKYQVYVAADVLTYLGFTGGRLEQIRTHSDTPQHVRIVLEFADLAPADVAHLATSSSVIFNQPLQLRLPRVILPQIVPSYIKGYPFSLRQVELETWLELPTPNPTAKNPATTYYISTLAEPTRIVLDIHNLFPMQSPSSQEENDNNPDKTSNNEDTNQILKLASPVTIAPGVVYEKRVFPSSARVGSSLVHIVNIAPNSGNFRVVGKSRQSGKLSQLAQDGTVAINAGYFDTRSLGAIGFLKVDDELLAAPSRNRASIGFKDNTVLIDRIKSDITVTFNGNSYLATEASTASDIVVQTQAGTQVGQTDQGVIVVSANRVLENKVGPRKVPADGFVVIYNPRLRDLAKVNRGDFAKLNIAFEPPQFSSVTDAVEAGPLLLKNGYSAYAPEYESFKTGTRIVDGVVAQSAIGVKADGTVLLVVAERMKAKDLITTFQSLGAIDAMRLDSGSSTTLYVAGNVVNRDNERQIVSAIVFDAFSSDELEGN